MLREEVCMGLLEIGEFPLRCLPMVVQNGFSIDNALLGVLSLHALHIPGI